ncbi:MAG: adenylate/guanylate cyclase domain-containing protein [Alphaproteobacteria bacterium]|nr:adenylate/guanylate cyclase domain-containing protein [Alphaproteobacteria bacterium]MCB9692103.1 adenylate/guanylate cyclase domain-containing protein [Alphaproteobacteria bacterium]
MSDPTQTLRGEVTRSILATLEREAVRNESTIAAARVVTVLGMIVVEAWLIADGSKLGSAAWPLAGLTVAMAVWSVALWQALRQGRWHPALPALIPTVDVVYFALRQGIPVVLLGADHFIDVQDLATVVGMSALLMTSGAFRLSTRAVVYAIVLGFGLYLAFAYAISLHSFFATVHMILLGAVGITAIGLTRIVDRAVQSEVTRLTVGRLLPQTVLDAASEDPVALLSEPRSVEVTILVSDLRGFTAWSEERPPLEVLAFLNRIQGALAEIVMRHHGTVDKFMGDGMLAVFGAPTRLEHHADRALQAAAEMREAVEAMGGPIQLGIGVHSGEVVVGCLGTGVRMEFTVLGDTVNTASRLESKTKEVGVPVLVSKATAAQATVGLRPLGSVELRGKAGSLEVYGLA